MSFGGILGTFIGPPPWLETGQGFLFAPVGSTSKLLLKSVRSALRRLAPQSRHLLVAVSGGRDSMVLLDVLRLLAAPGKLHLTVAHVHHGIRGPEADRDRAFVRTFASAHGLTFVSARVSTLRYRKRHRLGLEEAARVLRYRALERLRRRASADVIVTAHHADDQAETVFLRAARGAGLKGLAGILWTLENPPVIRPLLGASGRLIRAYAKSHRIAFLEDSSNRDLRMRRNLIRHHWMDIAGGQLQSNLRTSLVRLSTATQRLRTSGSRFIANFERALVTPLGSAVLLNAEGLGRLPDNVRDEIIIRFLARVRVSPTGRLLASVLRLLKSSTGRWISADGTRCRIYRERHGLSLVPWLPRRPVAQEIRPGSTLTAVHGRLRVSSRQNVPRSFQTTPDKAWVDAAAAKRPLRVRPWHPADRMIPLGMTSRKKVSDLLTDGKVPSHRRSSIMVVTSGGKIVWVCGVRLDDRFKVTGRTRQVLQFSYHSNV